MHVLFQTYPARRTEHGMQISFALGGTSQPLPKKVVEVKRKADLEPEIAAFVAEAEATGLPLYVSVGQHPQDTSRKLPGFDKVSKETRLTTAAETATEDEVRALATAKRG